MRRRDRPAPLLPGVPTAPPAAKAPGGTGTAQPPPSPLLQRGGPGPKMALKWPRTALAERSLFRARAVIQTEGDTFSSASVNQLIVL